MSKSLKTIACLKVLRGLIAIMIGVSLVFVYRNSEAFSWTDYPVLNGVASNDPFLQMVFAWLGSFNEAQILSIALLACLMGALRWIEAGGIWLNQSWAQWLAVFSGFIYIPFEVNELIYRFNWLMVVVLVVNTLIVSYLLSVLYAKRSAKLASSATSNRLLD
jgi:uncharacterized membrane protein (DUF2068 family)